MFANLIQIVGLWFLVACALEAVAVFVEQAGAARSPDEEDGKKRGASALLAFLLSLLTPGLLLAHGFLSTHEQEQTLRVIAMGLPIAAVLLGALLGAIFGAVARGTAPAMRKLALPLDLVAFAVAIFATLASIQVLIGAAQNGGVITTN
jgi:hypothetical protein